MKRTAGGIVAAVTVLAACGGSGDGAGNGSGLPEVQVLSPDSANHTNAKFSPDGSKVAYWSAGTSGWELTVADADLRQPKKLATSNSGQFAIVWSPDGANLAFRSNNFGFADVAIVPAAGGEIRQLTDAPGFELPVEWHPKGDRVSYNTARTGGAGTVTMVASVATRAATPMLPETRPYGANWSPDGSRIAYTVNDHGATTVWVADSAGGNAKQLTTEGLEGFSGWSPDGSAVLYTSQRTGTGDIWVAPVDGSAPRQLTRDVRNDYAPAWSRDGKWVAFLSNRGQQTDVWVVPAAGGEEIRITDDPAAENTLQWVGASNRLAFQKASSTETLWAVNAITGAMRQLTPDSLRIGATFRVSPADSEVVFQVQRGGGVNDLQILSMSGGAARTLVAGSVNNQDPSFSPDGKEIVFQSNRAGNDDIWVVPAAGGEPRQLTNWPTGEIDPSWSQDGKSIYFRSNRGVAVQDVWNVPASGGEPRRVTTTGNVWTLYTTRTTKDLFLTLIGGSGGKFDFVKLKPDGTIQTLWNKSNVVSGSPDAFSPSGDSTVIADGDGKNFIISTRTGQGRQVLEGMGAGDYSPDGTMLSYTIGSPNPDLGVLNLKDGTTRRLTNTPENESSYWWTADSKTIVYTRIARRSRITVTDVTKLLARARP